MPPITNSARMLTLSCYRQQAPSYDPYTVDSDAFGAPSIDPTTMYAPTTSAAGFAPMHGSAVPFPPSYQSRIVNARSDSAVEKFGQVTPPDQTPPDLGGGKSGAEVPGTKAKKLDKSERARNAAIQRHAKAKTAKQREAQKDAASSNMSASEDEAEDKREKYREKNRLAAAKCRAKKKDNVEGLETKHRELSASHNYLKRAERELRDELSMLRTAALQHTPASAGCMCDGLHNYNRQKANEVAYGFGVPSPSLNSPSDGGVSQMASPNAFGAMGRHNSVPGPQPDSGLQMFGRPQSFSGPTHHGGFASATGPGAMDPDVTASGGLDQQSFANFLQSSPGGRAGFS
jgi:hypothetical protein